MADHDLEFGKGIRSTEGHWYNVVQLLGRGRNATTYLVLASDGPYQGNLFALKLFHRLESAESRRRFEEEARFLRLCDHPAIMKLYASGTYVGELNNEHPFIVAEYLPQTLADVIRNGETRMLQKISFALNLVSALAYLEKLAPPVVHRDIKPANVFVKGRASLLGDFGLIKTLDQTAEVLSEDDLSEGQRMPRRYRTPDIVAYIQHKTPLTTKSDIFQLGLVLAELFFGSNPEKPAEDFARSCRAVAPRLSPEGDGGVRSLEQ